MCGDVSSCAWDTRALRFVTFYHSFNIAQKSFKDSNCYHWVVKSAREQEYVSKVARTEKDICALVDAGFEYVCDYNDGKVFRKRKY